MKKIILTLILSLIIVAPAQAGYEPVDLVAMQESGLSTETIGRYLAQNLGADRLAAPIDANLLTRLGQYGGNDLALAYLDLDRASMRHPAREFGPEVVDQLMANGLAPAELKRILGSETARYNSQAPAPQPAPAAKAYDLPPAAPAAPQIIPISAPQIAAPIVNQPQIPSQPRGYQDLRPGQAADPASRQPVPYSTYDIRQNRQDGQVRRQNYDGPWMGVRERELPDAHLVEVNSIGQIAQVGQEVYTRPSGHQVYRYFTGNPDQPYSGADLRQERKNREDLQIIFGQRREN